ncbi:MAG: N-acetyl-gamma-glutamyl-phosphate reductase [Dysgonamonadaceae bacterium]|jgi:N-acetyl-gamma-glutamyl-phosphate reductase|nr:N-acetyl-gamma-glutamyl-phosphate reductase [Dysgonamonadaceae bacterium]
MKIKAGIIGGAGYTAGELIRLLVHHPDVAIEFVHSSSNAGNRITDVHGGLVGETDLSFTGSYDLHVPDVLFLCSAHGDSRKFMETHRLPESLKVIDLSMDYRHRAGAEGFVYGLPELNRADIRKAQYLANPGCFATAIQLALLPLAANRRLKNEIHVNAITGATGAGVKPGITTHFSWRDNNLSVYKAFEHQHLQEIRESLSRLQPDFGREINFIPVRGNFSRGIFATLYTECEKSPDEIQALYSDYYQDAAFTHVTDRQVDLKQVIQTNKCLLHLEKHGNKLLIVSVIDNLLKGASGQAVQNFNLMFGLDEKAGLNLKPAGF